MDSIVSVTLTLLTSVISGLVLFIIKRHFKKQEEIEKQRTEIKNKGNVLILRSINALGKLTVANAIALRDGKTNGELTDALKSYELVEKEMYDYLVSTNVDSKSFM